MPKWAMKRGGPGPKTSRPLMNEKGEHQTQKGKGEKEDFTRWPRGQKGGSRACKNERLQRFRAQNHGRTNESPCAGENEKGRGQNPSKKPRPGPERNLPPGAARHTTRYGRVSDVAKSRGGGKCSTSATNKRPKEVPCPTIRPRAKKRPGREGEEKG